jgi:transcriptional regulator
MHTPPQFIESRPTVLHGFIREHQFATIVAGTADGLEAEHVPLLLDASRGRNGVLQGHVARANPIWQKLPDEKDVLVIFQGPNHYVSPGWYPSKKEHGKVVPTWNYIIVHVRGSLTWQHDRVWLRELLERITDAHEHKRNVPWQITDAPADFVERMLGSIVGFEISIASVTGKWKLSQNRSAEDRAGVVQGLEAESAVQAAEVVQWMSEHRNGS